MRYWLVSGCEVGKEEGRVVCEGHPTGLICALLLNARGIVPVVLLL